MELKQVMLSGPRISPHTMVASYSQDRDHISHVKVDTQELKEITSYETTLQSEGNGSTFFRKSLHYRSMYPDMIAQTPINGITTSYPVMIRYLSTHNGRIYPM